MNEKIHPRASALSAAPWLTVPSPAIDPQDHLLRKGHLADMLGVTKGSVDYMLRHSAAKGIPNPFKIIGKCRTHRASRRDVDAFLIAAREAGTLPRER